MRRAGVLLVVLLPWLVSCGDELPVAVRRVPPTAITDLRAEPPGDAPYTHSILLRWTVPEMPPGGDPIRQYEVRTSPEPRSELEWLQLEPVVTLHASQVPGAEESVVVSGLRRGQIHLFVVRSATADLSWSALSNVARLPTSNEPPIAVFSVRPDSTWPDVPVTVDASATTDLEDEASLVEVRWDWEDDGIWDTGWSTVKTASHLYSAPRVYSIRLEARDPVGDATQSVRRIVRGPTLLRHSERMVGYLHEVLHCYDPNSRNPGPCEWHPDEVRRTFWEYGTHSMTNGWGDLVSTVGVDTLRFDGGVRPGIQFPDHSMWVYCDVQLEAATPIAYRLAGRADCIWTFLRITRGRSVIFDLAPCGAVPREFAASGTLDPGIYRVYASISTDFESRMSFELVFEPVPYSQPPSPGTP